MLYDSSRVWSNEYSLGLNMRKITNSFFLMLLKYCNGSISFIKPPHGIYIGNFLKSTSLPITFFNNFTLGYRSFLQNIQVNSMVYDLTIDNSKFPKVATSSGTYCILLDLNKDNKTVVLLYPSKIIKVLSIYNLCTLGRVNNINNNLRKIGKAGINRNLGFKSIVRGVAKNPKDHPHGGKTKTNSPEVSPWGWITKSSH